MTWLAVRITRLHAGMPPSVAPRVHDLSRLTPDQCTRLAQLSERYPSVGLSGLTDDELHEIAELVGILEQEDVAS